MTGRRSFWKRNIIVTLYGFFTWRRAFGHDNIIIAFACEMSASNPDHTIIDTVPTILFLLVAVNLIRA